MKAYAIFLVLGVAGLSLACEANVESSTGDEHVARTGEALLGGTPDPGDTAIGFVETRSGACTATLITPSVILTAAHCAYGDGSAPYGFFTGDGAPTSVNAFPAGLTTPSHPIQSMVQHPSYRGGTEPNPVDGDIGFDVALMHLGTPVCGVTPYKVDTAPPTPGALCVQVGYGQHGDGTWGQRRWGTVQLLGVFGDTLSMHETSGYNVDGMIAPGDSGGPLMCNQWGSITGVATATQTIANPPTGYEGRIDPVATWITQTAAAMTTFWDYYTCNHIILVHR